MSKSTDLEQKILKHETGHATWTRAATEYFALFTAAPNDDGGGTEVSGNGYQRKGMVNDGTLWTDPVAGTTDNAVGIEFTAPTGSWGTVTHWAKFDAASGGNMIRWGALTTPRLIAAGSIPYFPVGSIVISED
jgi:hypothetical protein